MTGAVLAVDPGSRRVGVAVSDAGAVIALPLTVVLRGDDDSYIDELVDLARLREASQVVVGLPIRLDGSDGPEAAGARALAARLHELLGIPVHLLDERFTSTISQSALRSMNVSSKKQRPGLDKMAATVLLQSFLDSQARQRDSAPPQPEEDN